MLPFFYLCKVLQNGTQLLFFASELASLSWLTYFLQNSDTEKQNFTLLVITATFSYR